MLHGFIYKHREAIVVRAREKLTNRPFPLTATSELDNGIVVFLSQLSDALRWDTMETPFSSGVIGATAARHGAELLSMGFDVSQVVHDYGDICQAVTELAHELRIPITVQEFHTLNRCLDTAIAEAVMEHGRLSALSRTSEEVERLGRLAHELRNMLNTALLAFHSLKRGTVAINGSTGAVLGRNLLSLRDLVDSTLSEVRISAVHQRRERISVHGFLNDMAVAAGLHAEYRGLQFVIEPLDPEVAVLADPQLLASAVMNLLNNAFKFTRASGRVVLRAQKVGARVLVEVEDECGGIPDTESNPFQPFGDRRGADRSGLGLGLSIARNAVRAHMGDIYIRNTPGKGCVFVIDVPLAPDLAPVPEAVL